ncbi:MAG: sulfite exporter TauE/SafE family protein [Angelakisella sp.]
MIFQLIGTFFICIAATTIGAISGVGGGVIIKPVMDAVSGLAVSQISFLSGCTVLAMSTVSLLRSRGGSVKVDPRKGTLLAVGAAIGGLLGKSWFEWVKVASGNDGLVGTVQSILMILLTGGVLVYVLNKNRIHTKQVESAIGCIAIGLFLGILSSFLGIGGGPINLAVLYYFFSMDTKTAALNSIYIILFSQITSLASTFVGGTVPTVDVAMLAAMVVGGVSGGFLGSSLGKKMDNAAVDTLFRWLLVVITLISCYNLWQYAAMM